MVEFVDICVRSVPRDLWHRVRVTAAELDLQIREVVASALELWLDRQRCDTRN